MRQTAPQLKTSTERSEWVDSLRKGFLLGAAILMVALPLRHVPHGPGAAKPASHATRLAEFGSQQPSPDARQMANWVVDSRDHKNMSFVIVDKKNARVYVFDPAGHLKESSAALLGETRGDDAVAGIGDKPLSQVLPEEKTTPAGRFVAELGENTKGEDIVWVDYDLAVSMHRVRALVPAERRLERLASPSSDDNRISFGCINLPVHFYEQVLKPAVAQTGAVIYVLPETRKLAQVFAAFYDVDASLKLAQH